MKAEWITRDDGTHILPLPGRKTLLAEIKQTEYGFSIHILDGMMWTSTPLAGGIEKAKEEATATIKMAVGEIIEAI